MRFRSQTWWLLSLLCLLAGGYVWHCADQYAARKKTAPATSSLTARLAAATALPVANGAPPHLLPAAVSASVHSNATPAVKADRFHFRLTNTSRTVGQLAHDDHALLLENALIDTASGRALAIPAALQPTAEPGAYLVQARGAVDKTFRDALAQAGAEIVSYIPNNAYLVTATAAAAAQIARSPRTQSVQPFAPYFKAKSDLLEVMLAGDKLAETNALQTLVFPGQREPTLAALRALGAEVLGEENSGIGLVLTVKPAAAPLASIARLGGVHTLQIVKPRRTANDLTRVLMGVVTNTITGATNNYLGLTGSNVCVNVNDFGFDVTHPDLAPRVVEDVFNVSPGTDTDGHGTHVMGIIASSGGQSATVTNASGSVIGADFRGKAPAATIFGMTIQNYYPHTDTYLQEKTATHTNKPYISNNSWGLLNGGGYDITAASYDAAVRDALPGVTGSQPLVFVFAAGNEGFGNNAGNGGEPDTISSPATAKNVISVGASELPRNLTNLVTLPGTSPTQIFLAGTDSTNDVAAYSSRGNVGIGTEGDFGRFKPDVVAPGSFVVSTRSATWDMAAYYSPLTYDSFYFGNASVDPNGQHSYFAFPADNTIQILFGVSSNLNSIQPFNLLVTATEGATTASGNNQVTVNFPPFTTSDFIFFDVSNPVAQTNYYDVYGYIVTSNDYGDYLTVRSNMDSGLGPWYRYESGTSMSAPAVSGQLALMQEYFERFTGGRPSPAMMKALVINGARSLSSQYDFQVQSLANYQGWGLANLPNSLPPTLSNYVASATGAMLAFDQNPTNALATGQTATRTLSLTNAARNQPLRITLVWTDPPGDPNAAIKLVNDLDLVVTNLDNGKVYFGNDFQAGRIFNLPWDTNGTPTTDVINNVENIYLSPAQDSLGTNYSVSVIGRRVNVNAVTAHTNDYVQDYALIIACGNGALSNALTVTAAAPVVNTTVTTPLVTPLTGTLSNGIALLKQHVGANTPLLGTTNGMTNQWHFYIVTNDTTFTNIAFLTFNPPNLAVPRIGTRELDRVNAVRFEADLDLYVSTNFALTNLDPTAIATADVSQSRPGSEVVTYTNSALNTIYYIGVKSEDRMAAEYGFFGVSSELPFDETDANGNHIVRGVPAVMAIPDGTPSQPGAALIFGIATSSYKTRRVVVTNNITHELMADLFGDLQHSGTHVTLNNHTPGEVAPENLQTFIYDDSAEGDLPNSRHTDGPGSLRQFIGQQALGAWQLTMVDNAATHIGTNFNFTLYIEPESDTNDYNPTIQPGGTFYFRVPVPPEATNLTVYVSGTTQPVDVWIARNNPQLDANNNDFSTSFNPPGGSFSIDRFSTPPLSPGNYYVAVHNRGNAAIT
ncbi:MAG: hypothetical protein RL380_1672, partial [Verrucomicrobiota bacterium]